MDNNGVHPLAGAWPYPQISIVDQLAEDQSAPSQAPTLTELEAARAGVGWARHIAVESLMAASDMPDVEVLLAHPLGRHFSNPGRRWAYGLSPPSDTNKTRLLEADFAVEDEQRGR
jgi:hypothetical protein